MTLNEFNRMRSTQKTDAVWESAKYITKTLYGNYSVAIYALADFFVEVYFNVSINKIELIKGVGAHELHIDDINSIKAGFPFLDFEVEKNIQFEGIFQAA